MWFKQIIREETGCATYMIGADNGECLVFDPLWESKTYTTVARRKGAKIRYVVDSHTHADHVSGARRLTAATGGELLMPEGAEIVFDARRITDGDRIEMGEVLLEILHVPGHRPEQISLLVTDRSRGDQPWCLLTADFLLVGDIARPDLAQGGEEGAAVIFDRTLPRIEGLPDFVEVYPGHVAGSTCGRVTTGKDATTLGYERRFNTAMTIKDRESFIRYLNHGQPARPANVENIVAINQGRLPYAYELPEIRAFSPDQVAVELESPRSLVIDTRTVADFSAGHLPGSVNFQLRDGQFEQRIGWVISADAGIVFVGGEDAEAQEAQRRLAFVGLESRVTGYLAGGVDGWTKSGRAVERLAVVSPEELSKRLAGGNGDLQAVIDVREPNEFEGGHVAGALQISFKDLESRLASLGLDPDRPVAIYCASGNRSATAGSLLKRHHFKQVYNLSVGFNGWRAAGFPVE